MSEDSQAEQPDLIDLAADIISAYLSKNNVPLAELPGLIASVHASLTRLTEPVAPPAEDFKVTAAQIRKSITPDHLISFVDGRPYKSLKRHLNAQGTTRDDYRAKCGLGRDYPMVAARYAAQRSELAKSLGPGQIRGNRRAATKAAEKRAAPDPVISAPIEKAKSNKKLSRAMMVAAAAE
ncbi:hypothetical protein OPKNFCMD_3521 [Methylobacterium crusticola]|uniref:MucR family transcriptional regulator n=1 Tax=Methylobacterium crusticola TaxID=1697972 RepID=A0ABQ4QZD5_9HYPH|nr:MucR family transcriptional regulator [Methylobacterium crusticola]GJD50775.1 hypothetical protein OPKNFCMD_3521 [Methylobacterium crusticola]